VKRDVVVRRRQEGPPTVRVWEAPPPDANLDIEPHDWEFTRIWMAAVNGEGNYPPYAVVVGELYDGDPRQKDRQRVILDEGVALDARDFSPEEQIKYQIREKDVEYPSLFTLGRVLVALKDIWWPELLWVPPDTKQGFTRSIRNIDGLQDYDQHYLGHHVETWWPCFKTEHRTVPVVETPYEDPLTNLRIANALFHRDMLVNLDCDIWERMHGYDGSNEPISTPNRALGMVLERMQVYDMTYEIRTWQESDGYEREPRPTEEQQDNDIYRSEVAQTIIDLFNTEAA